MTNYFAFSRPHSSHAVFLKNIVPASRYDVKSFLEPKYLGKKRSACPITEPAIRQQVLLTMRVLLMLVNILTCAPLDLYLTRKSVVGAIRTM